MTLKRYLLVAISILLLVVLVLPLACSTSSTTPAPTTPATAKPAPTTLPATITPPAGTKPAATTPVASPAAKPASWPKAIAITVPPIGGALNVYGSTIAKLIERGTGVVVTPQPCTGSTEAVKLLVNGEAMMSGASGWDEVVSYNGEYKEVMPHKPDIIRGFTGAYTGAYHFFVRADSNIKSFADLKGKRCMWDRPGEPNNALMCNGILEAYGLTSKDIVLMPRLSYNEQVQALSEKTADCVMASSTPPSPAFVQLAKKIPLRLLSVDPDKRAQIITKYTPFLIPGTIKGGIYEGSPDNTEIFDLPCWIVVSNKLPEDFVYAAMKSVFEKFSDLQAAHAQFKVWKPADMVANPIVPYHVSALKYYKEAGLMTPAFEQKHNDLLKAQNQSK